MTKLTIQFALALAFVSALVYPAAAQFHVSGSATQTGSTDSQSWSGPGVFVDPINGIDNATCPASEPCQHLSAARAAVRTSASKNVYLAPGTYSLLNESTPGPWTFSSADSGTATSSVTYQAISGTATISGARTIAGSAFTYDPTVNCGVNCKGYYINLDANPSDVGYWQDFETLYFNGVRRPRPQATGTHHGYFENNCQATTPGLCVGTSATTKQQANALCGCPSNGLNGLTCALQNSPCPTSAPWMCYNLYAYSGTDFNPVWHNLAIGDIEHLAFQAWSMDRMRAHSAGSGVIQLSGPMGTNYEGGCYPNHFWIAENVQEMASAGEFYLDRCPGCASGTATAASTWRLNLYLNTAIGEDTNLAASTVAIPNLAAGNQQLLVANTLQYVTFGPGLEFQLDNFVPDQYGLGDFQGQPSVPAALSFTNSSNIVFSGVTVDKTQSAGIEFLGASTNNQIINSALYDIGGIGIRIGVEATFGDTPASIPSGNLVQNTAVEYFGRIYPSGEGPGIWLGDTHDNLITHNDIFGSYTGGIELGFGLTRGADDGSTTTQFYTYNNWLTYNHIWDQQSSGIGNGILSDHGGIYLASSLSPNCPTTGEPALAPANTYCNHILYNRIHDIVHNYDNTQNPGSRGIYLDQGTSNVEIRYNLVYRASYTCGFNNTPDHTGPNQYDSQWNLWDNNIFVGCGAAESTQQEVLQRGGDNPNSLIWTHNIADYNIGAYPQDVSIAGGSYGHWGCFNDGQGSEVNCTTQFTFDSNDWWNAASGNALSFHVCNSPSCSGTYPTNSTVYSGMPWGPLSEEDVHSTNLDPEFTNPNYPVDNFTVNAALTNGFQSWDYTLAGRTNPLMQVPGNIPDLFPVRPVNLAADFGSFPAY